MGVLAEGILENKPGKEDCPRHEDVRLVFRISMKSRNRNDIERTQK